MTKSEPDNLHLYNTRLPILWHSSDTPRPYFSRIGAKSLDLRENFFQKVCVTGLTEPGAGKTYIACALCIAALRQMRTVKYTRANYLLQEAEHNRQEGTYYEYSEKMAQFDLLVIDDFGLMDLNMDKCRDLFEIIESRDCRKATIIISQMPVANWYQLFGENTYADACLSRMTSKAYRLEFPGRDRRVEAGN